MNEIQAREFIESLPQVQGEDSFGYRLYFVSDERGLPFVSVMNTDFDFDNVSNLNREGVYRLNIGISRQSYDALFDTREVDGFDFTVLDAFYPHPQYAQYNYICIANPDAQAEQTRAYIREAHQRAMQRVR